MLEQLNLKSYKQCLHVFQTSGLHGFAYDTDKISDGLTSQVLQTLSHGDAMRFLLQQNLTTR